jgi:diguanylate cyclase (GGDEF)-like protein
MPDRPLGAISSRETAPEAADLPLPVLAAAQFAAIQIADEAHAVAVACVDAVRTILGGRVRLEVPGSPVAISVGDNADNLTLVLRFPVPGGEGLLWSSTGNTVSSDEVLVVIADQLTRIWAAQQEFAAQAAEIERLRFELAALQQVARTLAVVRGVEETEQLILDSVGEVFFSWWAALYRTDENWYRCRAVRSLRGEAVPDTIPVDVVQDAVHHAGAPAILPEEARIHAHLPPGIVVTAPLDIGEDNAGLLILGPRMTDAPYLIHDLALLRALADSSAVALRNADLLDRLRTQATVDTLTGCRNRRGFDELLALELARARRYRRPLSLVLVDLDHFKSINDSLGHEVGDHVLRRVGKLLRTTFRVTDGICRYGGEEFALIFPETPAEEGVRLAEHLRGLIEALPPGDDVPCSVTASMGVAVFPDHVEEPTELVRMADRALYRAKMEGRNRVEVA